MKQSVSLKAGSLKKISVRGSGIDINNVWQIEVSLLSVIMDIEIIVVAKLNIYRINLPTHRKSPQNQQPLV